MGSADTKIHILGHTGYTVYAHTGSGWNEVNFLPVGAVFWICD